ncbi:MAG: branched-chain amino acid ABC transporter permease, partial [Geminicoccaceae bacterium]
MKLTRAIRTSELGRGEPRAARYLPLDGESIAAVIVFLALAALPAVISGYPIYILPQYMLFGMLALSLGLLWGYVGIVSFGQAAFFALGAYTMGLAMQHPVLPVNPAYLGLLGSIVLGAALAGVIGYFLFSAGVRGAYFVIVTLALSIIVEQLAVSQSQITGGWNGMFIDRMSLSFGPLGAISLFDDAPIYYVVLVVVAAAFALLKGLSRAPFGKLLVGIRENEDRLLALGVRTSLYKTGAFALSG